MAKKSKSKSAVKKRVKRRRATNAAAAKTKKSKVTPKPKAPRKKKKKASARRKKGPRVIFEGSSKPKYACVYTAIDGVCIRHELNPTSGEYDLNPTRVSCDTCDHFVPPIG
jgi:hypothetical protein